MSAIFLLPVCFTYWSRKYTTRVDPHVDNSHQVWSWYDHTLPIYSVFVRWYVSWHCDLDLYGLEQWSCMAGHVTNPATKSEDPTTIRSWVGSYNGSHWLPSKMRTRPLRMRRITWPLNRGSKTVTFLESPTPICLFTIQLLLGYDDDISSTSKLIANFVLNSVNFRYYGNRGRLSEVWLPPFNWPIPKTPYCVQASGQYLLHKVSYSRFCVKNPKFSSPWQHGSTSGLFHLLA